MSGIKIPNGERGVVRLFAIDIPISDLSKIKAPKADAPPLGAQLGRFLGVDWIDPAQAELFDVADLEGLGLTGYLTEGAGIPDADVASHTETLNGVNGVALIVFSKAFGDVETTLQLSRETRFIGRYEQTTPAIHFEPLKSDAAQGTLEGPVPAPRNPYLNVILAIMALPILAFLMGAIIWGILR